MIQTKRLTLIQPTDNDCLILSDLWRNTHARQYLGGIYSEERIFERMAALKQHWIDYKFGYFAVFETASQNLLGLCGLTHSDDGVELSYIYFPKYWGNGYAFEAAKVILEYGFNKLKLERIIAITQEENVKSWKMLEKLEMQFVEKIVRYGETQRIYQSIRD